MVLLLFFLPFFSSSPSSADLQPGIAFANARRVASMIVKIVPYVPLHDLASVLIWATPKLFYKWDIMSTDHYPIAFLYYNWFNYIFAFSQKFLINSLESDFLAFYCLIQLKIPTVWTIAFFHVFLLGELEGVLVL